MSAESVCCGSDPTPPMPSPRQATSNVSVQPAAAHGALPLGAVVVSGTYGCRNQTHPPRPAPPHGHVHEPGGPCGVPCVPWHMLVTLNVKPTWLGNGAPFGA